MKDWPFHDDWQVEEVPLIDAIVEDPSSVQAHVANALNELTFALGKSMPGTAERIERAMNDLKPVDVFVLEDASVPLYFVSITFVGSEVSLGTLIGMRSDGQNFHVKYRFQIGIQWALQRLMEFSTCGCNPSMETQCQKHMDDGGVNG